VTESGQYMPMQLELGLKNNFTKQTTKLNHYKTIIMKKLILSAAIILGSFSTFAQQSTPPKTEQTTQTVQETYTEIKVEEVPETVKKALVKAYPTAILDKAFINEKKEYKLEIRVGEKAGALYADASGNWLKK
jgi:hypothetical protein